MCMEVLGLTFYELLWYFAIYSFLGWCMEVVFCTVRTGKLVNRGFLNGPVCPIYGFGMVLICILTAYFVTDAVVTVLTICRINRSLAVLSDMAAKLRRDSDALSGGLGRLALHADEQLARQRETLYERAQDTRAELEEKAQAQRGRLLEKQAAYHAALEEKRVQMQGAAERLRAEWLSRSTGVQRRMQRRLLKAFPRMRHERDGEALRRVRAWLEEKRR